MNNRRFIRAAALTGIAATLGFAAVSADAAVQAGNYQTHVLPSTTRQTASDPATTASAAVRQEDVVAGNYQTHVLPSTTRHDAVRQDRSPASDFAVNGQSDTPRATHWRR